MQFAPLRRYQPSASLVDELLIDIAVRIQLSPTMYHLAVDRYEAIAKWLEREGSPLRGRIRRIYPQGSMAIGATIRSKEDENLFDIDLIVEIDWPPGTTPRQMLAMLYAAIKGEKGSRYYDVTEAQSRCVTIHYADMHLDLTPMMRNPQWAERGGWIAHAKPGQPQSDAFVPANPWGFAQVFVAQTPAEEWFARSVLAKSYGRVLKADAEPIPEHEELYAKAMAVIALQLIKRHIYLIYERHPAETRRPPSVYIAESAGRNAGQTLSLVDEIIHQAACLRAALQSATRQGQLIDVRNPALFADKLTDRWPGAMGAQQMFTGELAVLEHQLRTAKEETDILNLQAVLGRLFGEKATVDAVGDFYKRARQETTTGTSRFRPATASAMAGLSIAQMPSTGAVPVPRHRFYGD